MVKSRIDITNIKHYIGRDIGPSRWLEMTQSRVTKFAEATGDFQWIHMDEERAKNELPHGKTIVHNFLLVSLVPHFFDQIVDITGLCYGQNRGLHNVQFSRPVPTGCKIRLRLKLLKVHPLDQQGHNVTFQGMMERQGSAENIMTLELKLFLKAAKKTQPLPHSDPTPLRPLSSDQHQAMAFGL